MKSQSKRILGFIIVAQTEDDDDLIDMSGPVQADGLSDFQMTKIQVQVFDRTIPALILTTPQDPDAGFVLLPGLDGNFFLARPHSWDALEEIKKSVHDKWILNQ